MVTQWTDRIAESGIVERDSATPSVVRILRLCPTYEFNEAAVPVEEYPYPPSNVQSAAELVNISDLTFTSLFYGLGVSILLHLCRDVLKPCSPKE